MPAVVLPGYDHCGGAGGMAGLLPLLSPVAMVGAVPYGLAALRAWRRWLLVPPGRAGWLQAARAAGIRGATPNVTPVLVTKASSKIPDTYTAEARPWASST